MRNGTKRQQQLQRAVPLLLRTAVRIQNNCKDYKSGRTRKSAHYSGGAADMTRKK